MIKTTKLAVAFVAVLAFSLALVGCGQEETTCGIPSSDNAAADSQSSAGAAADSASPYSQGTHHALLTVEGYEPIEITLDADSAPITVANFADLVQNGYYNGKTFYRFQDGFCMQGGTLGNSASGHDSSVAPIAGEFSSNGYQNALADNFGRGTVAMARTTDPDSASTTFFVTLAGGPNVSASLDGQYAAFGTIDEAGMAVVDQIVADHLAAAGGQMGIVDDESKQAVIESIQMID